MAPEHRQYLADIEGRSPGRLSDEFHYRGVVDREQEDRLLQQLDVLSVPATYDDQRHVLTRGNGVRGPGCPATTRRVHEIVERTGVVFWLRRRPAKFGEGYYKFSRSRIGHKLGSKGCARSTITTAWFYGDRALKLCKCARTHIEAKAQDKHRFSRMEKQIHVD